MIIDVHSHAGTKVFGAYDFKIDRQWLHEEMKMFDIQKTVIFPYCAPGSYDELNRELIESFADESILPFARLRFNFKPSDAYKYLTKLKIPGIGKRGYRILKEINGRRGIAAYKDEDQEMLRFTESMKHCRGIKFHDNQDGHLHEKHFEFLLSFNKPIVMHINPYKLEYFLSLYEDKVKAPIVIAHLGDCEADKVHLEKAKAILKKFDFLYTDTANHVCANHLVPFMREVPEKVLFGSDGPVISQGSIKGLMLQCSRELYKNTDGVLKQVSQNTAAFCRKSGWES
ncbi:MAG: hypothetical protein ACC650_05810 [Gammaproteobacteria bacterium]